MGQLSPERIIVLLGVVLLGIMLAALIVRWIARRRQPDPRAEVTISAPPGASPQPRSVQQAAGADPVPPIRLATSQASPQPSYTALAEAATRFTPKPAAIHEPKRIIDYSSEATTLAPDASYTATAITAAARAAQGLPPLEASRSAVNDDAVRSSDATISDTTSGASYTAVAIATAGGSAPREAAPPLQTRIDYSDAPTDIPASASYTAIAVATAARSA
jgi:hypothetical protein